MSFLGFVKLDKKIKDWEWYKDSVVKAVFIHCLVSANFEDRYFRGELVKRGSFICSTYQLAKDNGLSRQQVRTALKKLEQTKEITHVTSPNGSVIIVNKWDEYQAIFDEKSVQKTPKTATHYQPTKTDASEPTHQPTENNEKNGLNSGFDDSYIDAINPLGNPVHRVPKRHSSTHTKNKDRYIDIDKDKYDKGFQRQNNSLLRFLYDNIDQSFYITKIYEHDLLDTYYQILENWGSDKLYSHLNYITKEVNRSVDKIESVQGYVLASANRYLRRLKKESGFE